MNLTIKKTDKTSPKHSLTLSLRIHPFPPHRTHTPLGHMRSDYANARGIKCCHSNQPKYKTNFFSTWLGGSVGRLHGSSETSRGFEFWVPTREHLSLSYSTLSVCFISCQPPLLPSTPGRSNVQVGKSDSFTVLSLK